jgi:ArsR family metal-binding transcriptional regulator
MSQLINGYEIELNPPPSGKSGAWTVSARLKDDISEALPYLNAELKGADYDHDSHVLMWKTKERRFMFRPDEISASRIEDREEGSRVIEKIVDDVNRIWERRGEIKPNFEQRKLPTVIEIYKLLPKTNCKECDYPTCMAFANGLVSFKRFGKNHLRHNNVV